MDPLRSDSSFEAGWRRRFERLAQAHHEEHAMSGWSAQGLAARLEVFARVYAAAMPGAGARVLDLGCGPGTYGRWLIDRGAAVVGLDYSWPSLDQARRHDGARAAHGAYVQAEAYHVPFRAAAFDAVVCVGVLQTLSDAGPALAEMVRVLRPGGVLFLDALNALGFAVLRRAAAGRTVMRYSPLGLRGRLRALGCSPAELHPVVILPGEAERVRRFLQRGGIAALPLAHAFFLVARKGSQGAPAGADRRGG